MFALVISLDTEKIKVQKLQKVPREIFNNLYLKNLRRQVFTISPQHVYYSDTKQILILEFLNQNSICYYFVVIVIHFVLFNPRPRQPRSRLRKVSSVGGEFRLAFSKATH